MGTFYHQSAVPPLKMRIHHPEKLQKNQRFWTSSRFGSALLFLLGVIPMPWKLWWCSLIRGQRSGAVHVRGFHYDTGAHLVCEAGRCRLRVLAVSCRPAIYFPGVVADEGGGVSRAGDPEVGLARGDEGGHAGERTWGNPENWCVVVLPPDYTEPLGQEKKERRRGA